MVLFYPRERADECRVLVPLQFAVDRAIAKQEGKTDVDSLRVSEYMYTSLNQDEYETDLRARYVVQHLST